MLFVTAQVNQSAGQGWEENACEPLNLEVVVVMLGEDVQIENNHGASTGEVQTIEVLRAVATGHTMYSVVLQWNNVELRKVRIPIYVNMQLALQVVEPCNNQGMGC